MEMRAGLVSFLTGSTCGDNCWHAREEVCRCSCGGANHGCLLAAGAEQPARTARIDGELMQLAAVGHYSEMCSQADQIHWRARKVEAVGWRPKMPRYPAHCKAATSAQIAKWPELSAYRELQGLDLYTASVTLLWISPETIATVERMEKEKGDK